MKLSRRARYALRMMLEIARTSNENKRVSLNSIAQTTDMPRRYMEQLAISLKNASLVVGVTGKGGGYRLAHPAEDIRIGQIVESVIGPINVVECVLQPETCINQEFCECRPIYQAINKGITDVLYEYTLADLVMKGQMASSESELDRGCSCNAIAK